MDKYRAFYNEHKDKLFNYLMRMTGDYELSKDLMQESFTRYIEHYIQRPQSIPLLFAIARNALFDNLREQARRTAANEELVDPSVDQEKSAMVRQEYQRTLSAMNRLVQSERDVLTLVISGDLSYKEIASITGMTVANVKVKVHRARLKLRALLSNGGE